MIDEHHEIYKQLQQAGFGAKEIRALCTLVHACIADKFDKLATREDILCAIEKVGKSIISKFPTPGEQNAKQNGSFIYPKEAAQLIGVKTTKFYELVKQPGFPKSKTFGKRTSYLRSEIEEWIYKSFP